jgi:hypothetical protein
MPKFDSASTRPSSAGCRVRCWRAARERWHLQSRRLTRQARALTACAYEYRGLRARIGEPKRLEGPASKVWRENPRASRSNTGRRSLKYPDAANVRRRRDTDVEVGAALLEILPHTLVFQCSQKKQCPQKRPKRPGSCRTFLALRPQGEALPMGSGAPPGVIAGFPGSRLIKTPDTFLARCHSRNP